MNTPWGKSDSKINVTKGISFVGTPSHGGYAVTPSAAKKFLSESAIKRGLAYGGYLFFEEDCDYAIVQLELLEKAESLLAVFGDIQPKHVLLHGLSMWHADYLQERGIKPSAEGLKFFEDNRKQDAMRAQKHPDLIVSASGDWKAGVPKGMVEVTTADGKEHFVLESEYDNRVGLNLLSSYTSQEVSV